MTNVGLAQAHPNNAAMVSIYIHMIPLALYSTIHTRVSTHNCHAANQYHQLFFLFIPSSSVSLDYILTYYKYYITSMLAQLS